MILKEINKIKGDLKINGKDIRHWRKNTNRGMNVYYDLIDWLGGLPYEVASQSEIVNFCDKRKLSLIKFYDKEACIEYLFTKILE